MPGLSKLNLSEWNNQLLNQIETQNTHSYPDWFQQLQKQQISAFMAQGLPTLKNEDWRYTDVSFIKNHVLKFATAQDAFIYDEQLLETNSAINTQTDNHLLVFIDGHFNPQLSKIHALPEGVLLSNFATILTTQPNLIKSFLLQFSQDTASHPFACLNSALMTDGLFLYLPDNIQLKQPIYVSCLTSSNSGCNTAHLRHVIFGGKNSHASIFEQFYPLQKDQAKTNFYFNTTVTQIVANNEAIINHYKLQTESTKTCHIGYILVKQEKNSHTHLHNFSLGSCLTRDDLNIHLNEAGAQCELDGLYLLTDHQHIDQHTLANHNVKGTSSKQLYRGLIGTESTAVFNGRVIVHPGAKKSRAQQSNQNLLLSKSATVNTKPEFEIYADDVQCTHGATVGHIDEAAFFYLRARGLDENSAMRLLMDAFAQSVLKKITISTLAEKINRAITSKMSEMNYA